MLKNSKAKVHTGPEVEENVDDEAEEVDDGQGLEGENGIEGPGQVDLGRDVERERIVRQSGDYKILDLHRSHLTSSYFKSYIY